jgi:hypothetical protein
VSYQEDVLAEAISHVWGGEEVGPIERSEAKDLVKYLNEHGWRITREDTTDVPASAGPLQRALGMSDGGDGF